MAVYIQIMEEQVKDKVKELIDLFAHEHPDYPFIDNSTANFFGKRCAKIHVEGILKSQSDVYKGEYGENGILFDVFWKKVLEELKK